MATICPFCLRVGRDELLPAAHREYRYLICRHCGAGQLDAPQRDLQEFYDQHYFINGGSRAGYLDYEADEALHRKTARRRLGRVMAALDPGARPERLIEVGSATGLGLEEARSSGWTPLGVEISEWAAVRARARGCEVVTTLDEVPGDSYDAVTFFQSLEHLPDPVEALRRASELLRPGGVLVCETWDARSRTAKLFGSRWQQLSPPSVLWLFTEQAIKEALSYQGMELVSWRRTGKRVSLATVAGQSLPSGPLQSLMDGPLGRLGLPYFLDDLVTFTARLNP